MRKKRVFLGRRGHVQVCVKQTNIQLYLVQRVNKRVILFNPPLLARELRTLDRQETTTYALLPSPCPELIFSHFIPLCLQIITIHLRILISCTLTTNTYTYSTLSSFLSKHYSSSHSFTLHLTTLQVSLSNVQYIKYPVQYVSA